MLRKVYFVVRVVNTNASLNVVTVSGNSMYHISDLPPRKRESPEPARFAFAEEEKPRPICHSSYPDATKRLPEHCLLDLQMRPSLPNMRHASNYAMPSMQAVEERVPSIADL